MSGKLDQSLDEILSTQRKANRRGGARAAKARKPNGVPTAPAGGIKKSSKPVKPATKVTSTPSLVHKESKIVVSGLPTDVNEAQIKEYFQKSVGSVKRVIITYNQHGVSRGIAQIYFSKPDSAAKAAKDLNGMLVDKKPMKIEVVLDASVAPEPVPAKSLSERVAYAPGRQPGKPRPLTKSSANPKAQPKSATTDKAKDAAGKKGRPTARGRGRGGRGGLGRPKKTTEELDQEMTDYMAGGTTNAAANGGDQTGAPAGGDDLGMDGIS